MSTYDRSRTLLTVEEAANLLRRSPGTLRWWRHAGDGPPSFALGRRIYYDLDALNAWITAEETRTVRGGGA